MVNKKGEFPRDAKVSARVKSSTKRLLKKLKDKGHHESDVIEYAAMKLADEPLLLDWEIGELDQEIADYESGLFELKSRRQAKLNRLKCIAPKMIDETTLSNMLVDSAKEYALSLVKGKDDFDLSRLDNPVAKRSIMSTGKEWGYDELKFLDEVRNQVRLLCQTNVSDS